jgi:hypothetical protein
MLNEVKDERKSMSKNGIEYNRLKGGGMFWN